MKAHQRVMREQAVIADPRPQPRTLQGYSVEPTARSDALLIILHYEWLRSVGKATIFVGLLSPKRELQGVACFGYGPSGKVRHVIGAPALCLERGACVHYAPANAASFLISGACKLVHRMTGVSRFFACADPKAGEYGGVYQAAGWTYIGQGICGHKMRQERVEVLAPGKNASDDAAWQTTRVFRSPTRSISWAEEKAKGWQFRYRPAKHLYATCVGKARRHWCRTFVSLPYPTPYPELKRQ